MRAICAGAGLAGGRSQPLALGVASAAGARSAAAYELNDSHFHLTNYVQQGPTSATSSGSWATRSAASRSSASRSSRPGPTRTPATTRRPTTSRPTRRSTTTRSPTPASPTQYLSLTKEEQARFDPMITGFNPADMYAVDHIRRVLETFPGVFTGIGEFTIHKEFVSLEGRGRRREPDRPRARPHLRLRGRDRARRADPQRHRHAVREGGRRSPSTSTQMKELLRRHPNDDDDLGPHRARPRGAPGAGAGVGRGAPSGARRTSRSSRRCSRTRA